MGVKDESKQETKTQKALKAAKNGAVDGAKDEAKEAGKGALADAGIMSFAGGSDDEGDEGEGGSGSKKGSLKKKVKKKMFKMCMNYLTAGLYGDALACGVSMKMCQIGTQLFCIECKGCPLFGPLFCGWCLPKDDFKTARCCKSSCCVCAASFAYFMCTVGSGGTTENLEDCMDVMEACPMGCCGCGGSGDDEEESDCCLKKNPKEMLYKRWNVKRWEKDGEKVDWWKCCGKGSISLKHLKDSAWEKENDHSSVPGMSECEDGEDPVD